MSGEMAEWSIAAVLKTVEGNTSGGSNPSLSASNQSESAVTHKVTADLIFIPYKNPYKLLAKPRPIQSGWYHKKSGL